ncbi:MAG: hypothetical protein C0506_07745 [Anaerolinea sp.]|nr:hypothetical protein [Anaerolinea sp.]
MDSPLTAVVIDDNSESREELTRSLAQTGVAVLANTGAHSDGYRKAAEARPDLIFIRVEEPLARALAAIEYLNASVPATPIVAVSSSTSVSNFQQVTRAGARFLIEAPLLNDELARVMSAIRGAATPRPASRLGTGRVVAVVGQKGGVGKTAISVNLAAALAANPGNHVLIIDFDMSFGDVGLAMNVNSEVTTAQVARDLSEADRDEFKESVVAHPSGAFVLAAPSRVGEWLKVTPEQLESLVENAAALYDYVILDTPGAFNDAVAAAMDLADNVLVVTSLELPSVKNTAMLLQALDEDGFAASRALVVANCTSEDAGITIADLVPSLRRDAIWKVPFDPAVRKGSHLGQPAVVHDAKSPASLSIRALASRIETVPDRIDRRSAVREEGSGRARPGFRARLKLALSRSSGDAA